jgi:hypothetical protein
MSVILFFSIIILSLLGLLEANEDKIKYILYFIIFVVSIGFFSYCNWPAQVKKVVDEEKYDDPAHTYCCWAIPSLCQSCVNNPENRRNCECRFSGGGG